MIRREQVEIARDHRDGKAFGFHVFDGFRKLFIRVVRIDGIVRPDAEVKAVKSPIMGDLRKLRDGFVLQHFREHDFFHNGRPLVAS